MPPLQGLKKRCGDFLYRYDAPPELEEQGEGRAGQNRKAQKNGFSDLFFSSEKFPAALAQF
jgi:hypothetical protein